MKTRFFLQVSVIILHYEIVFAWIPGFGKQAEEPKRIRIYLDDDESLLVPENSRVEYVSPVINLDDVYLDKPPTGYPEINQKTFPITDHFGTDLHFGGLGQFGNIGTYEGAHSTLRASQALPQHFEAPKLKLEDVRIAYGGYQHHQLGGHGQTTKVNDVPIAMGKLLRPVLLLPNGYIHGVDVASMSGDIKPVTEETVDDLKYDFRTKTHSIRK